MINAIFKCKNSNTEGALFLCVLCLFSACSALMLFFSVLFREPVVSCKSKPEATRIGHPPYTKPALISRLVPFM